MLVLSGGNKNSHRYIILVLMLVFSGGNQSSHRHITLLLMLVLSGEATHANCIAFGLTQTEIDHPGRTI